MEWFMTHPTFEHRVEAIAKLGHIPVDRLTIILNEAGISMSTAARLEKTVQVLKD